MTVYLTRHGQTDLNLKKLMQGRTDAPLNETGRQQAGLAHEKLNGLHFDAVYASPLDRAIETAAIISGCGRDQVRIDGRITETDFGRYECRPYTRLGLPMTLYWALPEVFPAPAGVETIRSMVDRSRDFLRDLSREPCGTVLVVCHGGIIRALSGCLEGRKSGIRWRPKPHNTEMRIYELPAGLPELR